MAMTPLMINSLRGGLDDSSPPMEVAKDACTVAENVEFVTSALGERRKGCVDISLPAAWAATYDGMALLARHTPTTSGLEGDAQLWGMAVVLTSLPGATTLDLQYRDQTTWNPVTVIDAPDVNYATAWPISALSYAQKLFFALKSSVTLRSYVWDGTAYRRTGLRPPVAPAVADQGVGTLAGTRYYRVRYAVTASGTNNRQSEPSPSTPFTPSGAGLAARVSKPAAITEGETDWIVEASLNNADFFEIATLPVATLFYDDITPYTGGYAAIGPLSEPIGAYTLLPSYRYAVVDNDRLVMAASHSNSAHGSRVWWTPVGSAPGVGNNERLEFNIDPYMDLDPSVGGDITGISRAADGFIYVFKTRGVYKLVRTNQRIKAYQAFQLSATVGALRGSMVEAVDELGAPAIYFLDPQTGPYRLGSRGLEWCGRDIQTLWSSVKSDAIITPVALYYAAKRQVHFWIPVGSTFLNAKIIVHTNLMRPQADSVRRGWVTVPVGDILANSTFCGTMFSDNVDSTNPRNLTMKPLVGQRLNTGLFPPRIRLTDTGTIDVDVAYRGRLRTAMFSPAGVINRFGLMAGSVTAKPSAASGNLHVRCVRNYGEETLTRTTSLAAVGSETQVVRPLDDLSLSDMYVMQFEFGDLNTGIAPLTDWALNAFIAMWRPEERA